LGRDYNYYGGMVMTNYVVNANIEVEATSIAEAEDFVLGACLFDMDGKPVENTYIEINEVKVV
jgi:protocatechuate 3,4-dioxygenase beta subunit